MGVLIVSVAMAAVGGAVLASRTSPSAPDETRPESRPGGASAVAAVPVATDLSRFPIPPPLSPALSAMPPLSPSSAPRIGSSLASPSASGTDDTKSEAAVLSFTSDLPARVSIDGVPQGTTPLRSVRKPPGSHVVQVISSELDERLTTTLQIARGQAITVHAEFTRAVPALRVR